MKPRHIIVVPFQDNLLDEIGQRLMRLPFSLWGPEWKARCFVMNYCPVASLHPEGQMAMSAIQGHLDAKEKLPCVFVMRGARSIHSVARPDIIAP
eukprot:8165531-Karenia_brevis.AAC.1